MARVRDLTALLGLIFIAFSTFQVHFALGCFVVGVELLAVAYLVSYVVTATEETEEDDGP